MINKQNIQAALEQLYNEVNDFDTLQERLIDNCLRLDKLDKEEELYKQLDMPLFLSEPLKAVKKEKQRLLMEIQALEQMISAFDLNNVLSLIEQYESY